MVSHKTALILNYTGNSYHWGCFGTSTEIYLSLREKGYIINYFDVRTMHGIKPYPSRETTFDKNFHQEYFNSNSYLRNALETSDILVVNGEGTMHHYNGGQSNILFLMHYFRNVLGKPVHLINHSFLPDGTGRPSVDFDPIYEAVAKTLTTAIPREKVSMGVLTRMGIKTTQGFDCLPRFMDRNKTPRPNKIPKTISVSGGVNMKETESKNVATAIKPFSVGRDVFFVTGAKHFPAAEDPKVYQWMKEIIPNLIWSEAKSYDVWEHRISSSECFVSGRYHHTICAASNRVPLVCFPSNSPKIDSSCEMFGINPPIPYCEPTFIEKTTNEIDLAINGKSPIADDSTMRNILDLCKNNFISIPDTL
jgi:polysaccharide pyruvyl transferase WcaK-like protein